LTFSSSFSLIFE